MKKIIYILIAISLAACSNNDKIADAYGNFETDETLIVSEVSGKVMLINSDEGQIIKKDQILLIQDTTQLLLQKNQLLASIEAVKARQQDVNSQISVYNKKLEILNREKDRIEKMMKGGAATSKQFDDINGEIESTQKQLDASKVKLNEANSANLSQIKPYLAQIEIINDNISRAVIKSPIDGIILEKYVNIGEFARAGLSLFRIAPVDYIYLRAYISGSDLSKVSLGKNVKVRYDKDNNNYSETEGIINWISEKSEFTPKIVQTKEERVNLVYAVKVKVKNDGRIKIGMPGELIF